VVRQLCTLCMTVSAGKQSDGRSLHGSCEVWGYSSIKSAILAL